MASVLEGMRQWNRDADATGECNSAAVDTQGWDYNNLDTHTEAAAAAAGRQAAGSNIPRHEDADSTGMGTEQAGQPMHTEKDGGAGDASDARHARGGLAVDRHNGGAADAGGHGHRNAGQPSSGGDDAGRGRGARRQRRGCGGWGSWGAAEVAVPVVPSGENTSGHGSGSGRRSC